MLKHTAILASLLVTAAVAGCSRGEQPSANVQASAAPAPAAAPVANGGRKVEIIANDTMKFSIVEIRAKAGERLSVTLVNQGATPKFSMGHNWILLTPGADVDAFLIAAAEAATTDYVPAAQARRDPRVDEAARSRRAATPPRSPRRRPRAAIRSSVRTPATRRSACVAC